MPDPEISIVIVGWNVRDLLIGCLRSIERFVQTPHEVIVVDNHSHDESVAAVRQHFPRVQQIVNHENFGFARANNQGWQKARGRYICFLNPDTELINDPFPAILQHLRAHPEIGCLGPELLNHDRTHQPSVRRFPGWADQALVLLKLRHLSSLIPPLRAYHQEPTLTAQTPVAVDQVMGAAMIMPRSVLEEGGMFDEGYWIWFEEVDLCQRLHRKGLQVVYFPLAQIVHYGGQSFQQHLSLAKHVWFLKSLGRYAGKHWPWPARLLIYALMPISYLLTVVQTFVKPR